MVVLVASVLALLPRTLHSLVVELLGEPENTLYEVTSQRTIVAVQPRQRPDAAIYASLVVAGIDESARMATLRLSGQRACTPSCPCGEARLFRRAG